MPVATLKREGGGVVSYMPRHFPWFCVGPIGSRWSGGAMSTLLVASKVTVEQAEWLWFRGLGLPGGLVFCLLSLFYPRFYAAMYLSLVGSQKGSVHISVTSCSRIVFVYEFCNIIIPRLIPQNGSTDGGEDPFFYPWMPSHSSPLSPISPPPLMPSLPVALKTMLRRISQVLSPFLRLMRKRRILVG